MNVNEIKQIAAAAAMLLSAFLNSAGAPAPENAALPARAAAAPFSLRTVSGAAEAKKSTLGLTLSSRLLTQEEHADTVAQKPAGASVKAAAFPLTYAERDLVERVIMTSCGSLRSLRMAEANAQVVLDRVRSGRFGNGVTAVLTAPHQFEVPWKGEVNDTVRQAVRAVFDRGERVIDQPVYYYLNPHDAEVLKNTWAKNKIYVTTIGTGHFVHQYWTAR